MSEVETEIFNIEDVYDKEIAPLMKQVIKICKENKMPMIASFMIENHEEKGHMQCTTLLNHFENRKNTRYSSASEMIYRNDNCTFAMTITKEK